MNPKTYSLFLVSKKKYDMPWRLHSYSKELGEYVHIYRRGHHIPSEIGK